MSEFRNQYAKFNLEELQGRNGEPLPVSWDARRAGNCQDDLVDSPGLVVSMSSRGINQVRNHPSLRGLPAQCSGFQQEPRRPWSPRHYKPGWACKEAGSLLLGTINYLKNLLMTGNESAGTGEWLSVLMCHMSQSNPPSLSCIHFGTEEKAARACFPGMPCGIGCEGVGRDPASWLNSLNTAESSRTQRCLRLVFRDWGFALILCLTWGFVP